MIICLNTIQFLQSKYRQQLLKKLYLSLNWEGAFVYFEKIIGNYARFQDIINSLYLNFKRVSGLSPVNILNKEISLINILEQYTINANLDFLKRAGLKILCQLFNISVTKIS